MEFIAKTMHGLEELLASELTSIGAKDVKTLKRAVGFSGDLEVLYTANYTCRTAIRILKQEFQFTAQNEDELYQKVHDIAWEKLMGLEETFAIDASVNSSLFKHSKYASLKMKDAIVDRFRRHYGKRPDVDPASPDLGLHLHIYEDTVSVSIDSSGASLHKRGYRSSGHGAPLNEILAAGMIILSDWTKEHPLLDPMCGSGTLPLEAAMIASHTPAGYLRQSFAFQKWKTYDEALWLKIKKRYNDKIDPSGITIKASDLSGIHVRMARTAAEALGLDACITFEKADFFELEGHEGYIMMNPPYGERMDVMDIETFYEELADHLKRNFAGSQCWLISSNNDALLRFGLRPSKRITLYNGQLECLYQRFDLYKGSKKAKYQDEGHIDNVIREHGEQRNERTREDRREQRSYSQRGGAANDRRRKRADGPRSDRERNNDRERRTDDRPRRQSSRSGEGRPWKKDGERDSRRPSERKPWKSQSDKRKDGDNYRSSSSQRDDKDRSRPKGGKLKWSREGEGTDRGGSSNRYKKDGPSRFDKKGDRRPPRKRSDQDRKRDGESDQ